MLECSKVFEAVKGIALKISQNQSEIFRGEEKKMADVTDEFLRFTTEQCANVFVNDN